jgi:hypothetical protein
MRRTARWISRNASSLIWGAWAAVFVVYEAWALVNEKDGDTLSETTRRVFRTRTSKLGRAVFTVAVAGGAVWYLLHILTETM